MDPLCIPAPNPRHPILPFRAAFSGPCILTNPKVGGDQRPFIPGQRQSSVVSSIDAAVVWFLQVGKLFWDSTSQSREEQGRQHPVGEMLVIPTTTRFQLQKALLHH